MEDKKIDQEEHLALKNKSYFYNFNNFKYFCNVIFYREKRGYSL